MKVPYIPAPWNVQIILCIFHHRQIGLFLPTIPNVNMTAYLPFYNIVDISFLV